MRRALVVLLVLAGLGVLAPSAMAHPLGNFSINHLSKVKVSDDRVDVLYVLDEAEIPTTEQRGLSRAELIERKQAELRRNLSLVVDGRRVELRRLEPRLNFPSGQAGLETTRFEQPLRAPVSDPRRVQLRDNTFADRVGWKAVVSEPGSGTAVRTNAPSGDPTNGLRRYPEDLLDSPLDRREASFLVQPGAGTLVAPRSEGGETSTTRTGGDGFAGIFEDAASGEGVLVLLLLAAFGWGALHALSPGHGKAMVAAYLVGTRGKPRHAVALGATVTVAHTIGVFALGIVTLALSQYILPEDLYPWLNLVSGLLVVVIGAGVLRARMNPDGGRGPSHRHGHSHDHGPARSKSFSRAGFEHFLDHVRGREHSHDHGHAHAHRHSHSPSPDDSTVTKRSLIGLGAAAGLIPCPSALVVLLGAISQHEVALGLLLITAFSLGLAGTLTGLGLAVVWARQLVPRLAPKLARPRGDGLRRVVAAMPAASALVIVAVGCLLTAQALPGVV
jgi:ABC-type nickel/cobalt efflux system permease component RcnA